MKISVVVPVYNVEKYLRLCLDSIFMQSYRDFEVVCVNDGSTDSSLDILDEYKQLHKNFNCTSIPNSGQANARNIGVQMASGEFICFIDSDDTIDHSMFQKLVDVQEKDQCDMVVCGINRSFSEGCSKFEKAFKYDGNLVEKHNFTMNDYPTIITIINNSPFSKLIRRTTIVDNHIVFPTGYIYEDMVFTHKLLATGLSVSVIEDTLYNYVVRVGSTMTSRKSKVTDMFDAFQMVLEYYRDLEIDKKFKKELDYLALYHIGIGTSFRMFRSHQYSLFKSLQTCRAYLRKIDCNKRNEYINSKSIVEKLFIKLFM